MQAVLAARGAAALFDLSDRGKVEVVGQDRAGFLHAILTQNILKLEDDRGAYAALLGGDGRLVTDLFAFAFKDRILLDVSPGRTQALLEGLNRCLVSEDVILKDCSGGLGMFALLGPAVHECLKKAGFEGSLPKKELSALEAVIAGSKVIIIRHAVNRGAGFDIVFERARGSELRSQFKKFPGLVEGSGDDYGTVLLESGIPLFGREMDERTIPLEAGLEEALDHTKGCYLGQEVIARIRDRGHVAKLLMYLEMEGSTAPPAGAEIAAGDKIIGSLKSACYSPNYKKLVGMGYVDWGQRGQREVEVRFQNRRLKARVSELSSRRSQGLSDFLMCPGKR